MHDIINMFNQNPFLFLILACAVLPMLFKFVINIIKSLKGHKVDNNYDDNVL